MISWAGATPYVVALTKSYGSSAPRSNLYISTSYGEHFVNVVKSGKSCLCVGGVHASIDTLYHASAVQKTSSAAVSFMVDSNVVTLAATSVGDQ